MLSAAVANAACVALMAPMVMAETYVPTSGTSSWNNTANWNPNTIPNGTSATAIFPSPTAARSTTLNGSFTVKSITINNTAGTTLQTDIGDNTAASTGTLTFDGAGNVTADRGDERLARSRVDGEARRTAREMGAECFGSPTVIAAVE